MALTFIGSKEERFIFEDWTANIATKLVPLEWALRLRSRVKSVACVKIVVANVVIKFAVELVCAGAGSNGNNSARIAAIFRAIRGIVYLEFCNEIGRASCRERV